MIVVHIAIRENATGDIRLTYQDFPDVGLAEFMFADGNFSCDCNRRLFFRRAGGEDDLADLSGDSCGGDAFSVLLLAAGDTSPIYSDFP
jgi:hypothetical protein